MFTEILRLGPNPEPVIPGYLSIDFFQKFPDP